MKWPVSLVCQMSSGCTDLCTFFTIWDTDRALYNCQHPTILGTLAIFHSTVFLISLSLVSKLKLNTQVLKYSKYSPKYSGTPWGTQILEYSMWYCLKYLYIEYFLAVKGPGSLKFLACHISMKFYWLIHFTMSYCCHSQNNTTVNNWYMSWHKCT